MAQIEKSIGMMEQACREHFSSHRGGFNSSNYGVFGSFSSNRSGHNGVHRTSNDTSFNVIGNSGHRSGYFGSNRNGYFGANRSSNNASNRSGYNNAFRSGHHHTFNSGFFSTKWATNNGADFNSFGSNSSKFSNVHNGNHSGFQTGKYHHHYSYWTFNWAGNGSKDVQLSGNAIKRGNFQGHNASKYSGNGKIALIEPLLIMLTEVLSIKVDILQIMILTTQDIQLVVLEIILLIFPVLVLNV